MHLSKKGISRLKMVAYFPAGQKPITWYSPIKDNNKSNEDIIKGMISSFKKLPISNQVNVFQFYENDIFIHKCKP